VVAPDLAEKIKVITNGGGTSQGVLDAIAALQTQIDTLIPSQTGNAGKFLTTNGTTTSWASVTSYTNADVDAHLNTSTATTNQVLGWNGSDYDWVGQLAFSGGITTIAKVSALPGTPDPNTLYIVV